MALSTAVDRSAVARVVGIETNYVNLKSGASMLPQRIALVGQGSTGSTYSTTKQQVTSSAQVGSLYGYGSPLHLASKQLFPANGDGVGTIPVTVYPLEDAGSGVASTGEIAISGTVTAGTTAKLSVSVNNIESQPVVITDSDTPTTVAGKIAVAVAAVIDMPVDAGSTLGDVTLTSKWMGASANGINIAVSETSPSGLTYAITGPSGGLVNPSIQTALDQVGNVWETLVINCLDINDSTALDAYNTFGEGRWGSLVRKPLVVLTGNTAATVSSATSVSGARSNDRINGQLVAPGSLDLPFVVAARQVAKIAVRANTSPAFDYGSLIATGLTAGSDGEQWDYAERDLAVKAGSSTIESENGVVKLSDIITFYNPVGVENPGYRYVVDIVKIQNILFNLDLIFSADEWDGAPLIPDEQPTTNGDAKKPMMAKTEIASLIDNLGLEAIISDPAAAKRTIDARISSDNAKRLEWTVTMEISGNSNIISGTFNYGFYFGENAVVA